MRKFHLGFVSILLIFMLATGSSFAKHHHRNSSDTPSSHHRSGNFDYYVLSLSWSPEFCSTPAGHQPQKQAQCDQPFGFVVHGLWPQFNNGYPQDCGHASHVPPEVADIALKANPPMPPGDPGLIDHEWSKHGTCSGLSMEKYFTAIKTAAEKVKIPDELKAPKAPVKKDFESIVALFSSANPGLTDRMIEIKADTKADVSEVDICLDKQLVFRECQGQQAAHGGTFLPVNQP